MNFTLPIILGIALSDSLNPTLYSVLDQLLRSSSKSQVVSKGVNYTLGVMATYYLVGIFLIPTLAVLGQANEQMFKLIGAIIVLAGLVSLTRRYLTPSPKPHPLVLIKSKINWLRGRSLITRLNPFLLGVITAVIEIPINGLIFLAFLTLLSQSSYFFPIAALIGYVLVICFPLLLLTLATAHKTPLQGFRIWEKSHTQSRSLRYGSALLLTILGLWIIVYPV